MGKNICGSLVNTISRTSISGFDTCVWNPDDVCRGSTSEQCSCSAISYVVWAACDACSFDTDTTWDDYADNFDCPGLPQQYPPPFPSGKEEFASWAFAMVSATPTPTTFDLEAASAFVLSPPTPPPTTTTQDTSSITIPPTATPPTTTPPTATPPTTAPPTSTGTTTSPTRSNVSTSLQTTASSGSPVRHTATESPSASGSQSIPIATSSPSTTASVDSGGNVTPTSTSAPQLLPSTHRKQFPTGAIVGIVIGICLILLAILFVWLRRRRRQAAYPTAFPITSTNAGTSESSNASALDDSDLHSTSAAGRHHLRTDSRGVGQEKMLSEESRSLTSSSPPTYPPGRNVQLSLAFGTLGSDSPGAPGPDVVWQLREMTARVRELEAQLESPPPGYSGEES